MSALDLLADELAAKVLQRIDAGDDLVMLPGPFGQAACEKLRASGELPARKIGHKWFARKSDLLALIPRKAEPKVPALDETDADVFARARAKGRRTA